MSEEAREPGTINLAFIEDLYAEYLRDSSSVSQDWREYFGRIRDGDKAGQNGFQPTFTRTSVFNPPVPLPATQRLLRTVVEEESTYLQDRVDQLIRAYRICG